MNVQFLKSKIAALFCMSAAIATSGCVAPPPAGFDGFTTGPAAPTFAAPAPVQAYQYAGAWCRLDNGEVYRIAGGEPTITIFPPQRRFVTYVQVGDGTFQDETGPGTYRFSGNSLTWRANNGSGQTVQFSRC